MWTCSWWTEYRPSITNIRSKLAVRVPPILGFFALEKAYGVTGTETEYAALPPFHHTEIHIPFLIILSPFPGCLFGVSPSGRFLL